MALRMVALNRAADGRWFARKGIPKDVRGEYERLYGHKREAHLKLPADTSKHAAKALLGEWSAEVEPASNASGPLRKALPSHSRNSTPWHWRVGGTLGSFNGTKAT